MCGHVGGLLVPAPHPCIHASAPKSRRGRALDSLKLRLQVAVSCLM